MESYWSYLARLVDMRLLRAQRRLMNSSGCVICGSGDVITLNQLELIHQAYLISDIEKIGVLTSSVNSQWLFDSIQLMLSGDGSLAAFHKSAKHDALLSGVCRYVQKNDALMFRLEVLSLCEPDIFKRSMFCAWISLVLFDYMARDEGDIFTMFEVAIAHDVGMLELPLEAVEAVDGSQVSHDFSFYQHAQFGADFIRNTGKSSVQVYQAICQHHETIDGSGFPHGLCGVRLNEFGQIVNMFDSLYVIYTTKFKPVGRAIADLAPIVEMNSVTRFGYAAKQLVELLKTGERTRHFFVDADQVAKRVKAMRSLFLYVDHANTIIQQFTNEVGFRHEEKGLSALQNGFFHIALTIHKSPYINEAFVSSMASSNMTKQTEHYDEIEDATLMLNEVVFHILAFKKQLSAYALVCKNSRVQAIASETLQRLEVNLLENV